MEGLITCDLICLGAASPRVFAEYISWLSHRFGRRIVGYEHRGKWAPWGTYIERAELEDGTFVSNTTDTQVWRRIWNKALLRPSCYKCGFHSTSHPGDLTIGDFWGIKERPGLEGLSDELGISCILSNSIVGTELLQEIEPLLQMVPCEVQDVANESQSMLRRPPKLNPMRSRFWAAYAEKGLDAGFKAVGVISLLRRAKDISKRVFVTRSRRSNWNTGSWPETKLDFESYDKDDYPLAFAAKNRLDEVRKNSSSGGIFQALARYVIEQNGVVYGCAFDESLHARHIRCETMDECKRCMGSKYSQSDMGDTIASIRQDLSDGRLVLFTGMPCQVAAVKVSCK